MAQVSLTVTLLVGSGLSVHSFLRLAAAAPGFDPAGALTFGVTLPERAYATPESQLAFQRRMLEGLNGLPGVSGAAAASAMPLAGFSPTSDVHFEGWREADVVRPVLPWKQVSPGYFQTMGVALVEGREFDRLDPERAPVAVVSRSLARTYWPGEPALGQGIRPGGLAVPAAYLVTRRRREIAVRMAVGARVTDIRRLVLMEAAGLALGGAALGAGAAMALTRQLRALLFETSPLQPEVFAAVAALLAATCLLASWLPARRATHIDPMAALRVE